MKVNFSKTSLLTKSLIGQKPLSNAAKNVVNTVAQNPLKTAGLVSVAYLAGRVMVNKSVCEKTLTDEQFNNLLEKNGYIKDNDTYIKQLTEMQKSYKNVPNDGREVNKKKVLIYPISENQMKGFKEFLELADGKALKHVDKEFDNLMTSYLILDSSELLKKYKNLVKENPAYHDLTIDAVTKPISIYAKNLLANFKINGYLDMNEYLRKGCPDFAKELGEQVEELTNYINTQEVKDNIKTYRTEGMEVLKDVRLQNGESFDLRDKMMSIQFPQDLSTQEKKLNELKEFILDNEITAHQPSFMSTSLDKNIDNIFAGGGNKVFWEFNVPKGTKGIYLEALNANNTLSQENEFLVQRGSDIIIKSLDYNKEKGQWTIKAEIQN